MSVEHLIASASLADRYLRHGDYRQGGPRPRPQAGSAARDQNLIVKSNRKLYTHENSHHRQHRQGRSGSSFRS